jgi:hypothetical protein
MGAMFSGMRHGPKLDRPLSGAASEHCPRACHGCQTRQVVVTVCSPGQLPQHHTFCIFIAFWFINIGSKPASFPLVFGVCLKSLRSNTHPGTTATFSQSTQKNLTIRDDIAQKHAIFLSGLDKLYDTLLAMRYIFPEDMVKPPHTTEALFNDTYQTLGYEPETVELMRLMPFLRGEVAWGWQKDGVEILPRSKAVSYAIERESEWIDYLRWGDHFMSSDHQLLPPWMLRLSVGQMYPGQYGTDLIYDTRTRTYE